VACDPPVYALQLKTALTAKIYRFVGFTKRP
jgi:hypothetical protein